MVCLLEQLFGMRRLSLGYYYLIGKDLPVCTCMCGSAHDCGFMVGPDVHLLASSVSSSSHVNKLTFLATDIEYNIICVSNFVCTYTH